MPLGTLANTSTWATKLALEILVQEEGSLNEHERGKWILDLQYWRTGLLNASEFELDHSKLPPPPNLTRRSSKSPQKKMERNRGRYFVGKFNDLEWNKFRSYPQMLKNLDAPLIYRAKKEFCKAVILFSKEVDCAPTEKELFDGQSRLSAQKNLQYLTRKLNAETNNAGEKEIGRVKEEPEIQTESLHEEKSSNCGESDPTFLQNFQSIQLDDAQSKEEEKEGNIFEEMGRMQEEPAIETFGPPQENSSKKRKANQLSVQGQKRNFLNSGI